MLHLLSELLGDDRARNVSVFANSYAIFKPVARFFAKSAHFCGSASWFVLTEES